jgi:hypothetical protein
MANNRAGRRGFCILPPVIGALTTVVLLVASAFPPVQAVRVGEDAPDVELQSIDGEILRLSDFEGDKNVVLVFFRGTW